MYKRTVIALVAVCLILTLGLLGVSVAFGVTEKKSREKQTQLSNDLENVYKRNYYEFCYQLSNVSDSLNKVLVSDSSVYQQKMLVDISEDTASAVSAVSSIADTSSKGEKTVAFINKTGDYAKSLCYKLASGQSLTEEDKNNLTAIYNAIVSINDNLAKIADSIEQNYNFLETANTENDAFLKMFGDVEIDIKYPTMIYDGPFSDALEEKNPSLTGETINIDVARNTAKSYLPFDAEVENFSESNGSIPTYIFKTKNGATDYFVTVAKNGGWLVSLTSNAESDENNYGQDYAVQVATDYLEKIGITDVEAVWCSDYNSIYYINFVYKTQDTLVYPDMIKVKVSAKDKSIVGVEMLNYIYNHKERSVGSPVVSREDAEKKVNGIEIENVRLAIIPLDNGKEELCWEVAGKSNEDYYFVYVSAETGDEINLFRVVDSAQGKLLV